MGTMALLEHIDLGDLSLYFPISAAYVTEAGRCVSLIPSNRVTARLHLPSGAELLAQHRPRPHNHSWCVRMMQESQGNPRALFCPSAKTKRIKSPHNRCADVWATNGSLWTSLWFAPAGGKMSHRLLAQRSTGNTFPRWWWVSFHLVTGCSRTCYLQGVQPAQFLARLCLLAVQGGQELPSHPETKEEVKGSVC